MIKIRHGVDIGQFFRIIKYDDKRFPLIYRYTIGGLLKTCWFERALLPWCSFWCTTVLLRISCNSRRILRSAQAKAKAIFHACVHHSSTPAATTVHMIKVHITMIVHCCTIMTFVTDVCCIALDIISWFHILNDTGTSNSLPSANISPKKVTESKKRKWRIRSIFHFDSIEIYSLQANRLSS